MRNASSYLPCVYQLPCGKSEHMSQARHNYQSGDHFVKVRLSVIVVGCIHKMIPAKAAAKLEPRATLRAR